MNNSLLQSQLQSQPLLFLNQVYPKNPWYPKDGQPCGDGCGATSSCKLINKSQKICVRNKQTGTVFSKPVIYFN